MDELVVEVGAEIDRDSGLLEGVHFLPSPHCDLRPDPTDITLIVVHGISLPPGKFGTDSIERFFCGQLDATEHPYYQTIAELRVSSHVLIKRDGEMVQFVPFHQRAWHAGKSQFEHRIGCNDFSVGIELEGTDELPYELAQYAALARVIKALRRVYPGIKQDNVVGHEDIAPGRKTDPGPAFDWQYLKGLLR